MHNEIEKCKDRIYNLLDNTITTGIEIGLKALSGNEGSNTINAVNTAISKTEQILSIPKKMHLYNKIKSTIDSAIEKDSANNE